MDFFGSKESLTTMEWILRAVISFLFLMIVAKLMGQRSISQLRFLDFIIALTLGNIIAHPLSDEKLGLKGSMITTLVLILLYIAGTWLGLRWPLFRHFLDPVPVTLVQNGSIHFKNLSKAKISIDYLFSELRKEKVEDIQKVSLALWEPGGTISVFMDTPYQPVTPGHLKWETKPFSITRPIIIQGKIDLNLLQEMNRDEEWLYAKLAPSHTQINKIILATITDSGDVQVYTEP
ncbi:DUF421 domain-containing protein [Paenibacillus dakarensis]|uniref:DUF421 domain-containing protein n=1 Tax=Paenibacillus dakarensis TaxID=1527293 RepID=UPI0006D52D90|nr:DUF421 domain-containing protein [Paenibacillus dakarensis]